LPIRPLGRTTISGDRASLLYDAKTVELVAQIDYGFSTLQNPRYYGASVLNAAQEKRIGDRLSGYLAGGSETSAIDLGAGLDAAFYRVDNGMLAGFTGRTTVGSCEESFQTNNADKIHVIPTKSK